MSKSRRYPPEVRERAVALVLEHQGEHRSQWAAMQSIAAKFGMAAETLRSWVRQAERDRGLKPGPTSEELVRIKELERLRYRALHTGGLVVGHFTDPEGHLIGLAGTA
jgi:transposase